VRKIQLVAADDEGGAGGAHAVECGIALGIVLNAGVGCGKGLDQSGLRIVAEGLVVDFANGFNRHAAGFLTAFVSAHSVGDDGEASLALEFGIASWLPIEVGVLIVFALAAHVTQARHLDSGFQIHAVNRHVFTASNQLPQTSHLRTATSPAARRRSEMASWKVTPAGRTEAAICPGHYRQAPEKKRDS